MARRGKERTKVTEVIEWQSVDPNDLVGHRFIAKTDDDEVLDGWLRKAKIYEGRPLQEGDFLYSLRTNVRVFKICFYAIEDSLQDSTPTVKYRAELKAPFTSIIVLKETRCGF